jgi:trigger factor
VSAPEKWKRVISFEIPRAEFDEDLDRKLVKYGRQLKIAGFRPGKAPANIVKARYGATIRTEVVEDVIQKSFEDACTQNDIVPIARARVGDLRFEEGQSLTFTIETEVDPPVEIRTYRKLRVRPNPSKIKSGNVDGVVRDLRERMARFDDVERVSKKGDFVTLEYVKVMVDGAERSDVSSPKYPIEVGASSIKEFDKSLVGRAAGETFEVSVKFPKDYGDREIAGKSGSFEIKVVKVQERILPEVDESFLKKVGDFKDEGALREAITKDLEARERERAKNEAYNKAIDTLIKDNPFDVPPSRVAQYIDHVYDDVKQYVRPGETPPSREEIEKRYRDIGIRTIKRFRVLDYVARQEKIKATQEEVDRQIEALARQYNRPFEELKQRMRREGATERIREDIRERKTLDFLIGDYTPPVDDDASEAAGGGS